MLGALATKLAERWRPGVRVQDLERLAERNPFSAFLPYLAYDPETRTYVLQDETVGALWECAPLAFASEQTVNGLDGLFRLGLPEGAVLQFIDYDGIRDVGRLRCLRRKPGSDHGAKI